LRHLRITLDDEEYEKLLMVKGRKSWRELLLECIGKEKDRELLRRAFKSLAHSMYDIGSELSEVIVDKEVKKMMSEEEATALLALRVSGEELTEEEEREMIQTIINLIFSELEKRNQGLMPILELLRVALIHLNKGNTLNFFRALEEACAQRSS
jgi:predicted CopG family antitoxin